MNKGVPRDARGKTRTQRGFTLIEILIVIGIIAILAAIVIIAINPSKQFAQARNSQRVSNVNAILNAIGQRMADNKGVFAGTFDIGGTTYRCGPLTSASSSVSSAMATDTTTATGDLGCLVPTYIASFPIDPSGATSPATGYEVSVNTGGRVLVCAPAAGNEAAIPNAAAICVQR